MTLSFKNCWIY